MNSQLQYSSGDKALVVHIIHRLAIGGLENGVVNLVNRMSTDKYQHAIISLTDIVDFEHRIENKDVACYALEKREGIDLMTYFHLWKILAKIRPQIVHTRNFGTLDCQFIALMALVPRRIHGEHGRDLNDIDGRKYKNTLIRKLFRPIIDKYVALSRDIERWLRIHIKVPRQKIIQIYNGVDTEIFYPAGIRYPNRQEKGEYLTIGTVGRLQGEKDQITLVKAINRVLSSIENRKDRNIRLVIVGDGPLRQDLEGLIDEMGISEHVELLGSRDDINELMRKFDLFVLPSLTEGISNTILEAMATGLPVIATNVGGNPELVLDNETGVLVPVTDDNAIADAIIKYIDKPELLAIHGDRGRHRVLEHFSIDSMVKGYESLYDTTMEK